MSNSFAAAAGPDGQALDRIRITGVSGYGRHGVLESERATGQEFRADVVLYLDTRPAAEGDDLRATVSYADVAQETHDILVGEPVDLLETLAERIAAVALAHDAVFAVDVSVHKPQAPIPVAFADVEVAIRRDRVSAPPVVAAPSAAGLAAGGAGSALSAHDHGTTTPGHEPAGGVPAEDPLAWNPAETGGAGATDPAGEPAGPVAGAPDAGLNGLVVPEIDPLPAAAEPFPAAEAFPAAEPEPAPAAQEPIDTVPPAEQSAPTAAPAFEPQAGAPARPLDEDETARRPAYDAAGFAAGAGTAAAGAAAAGFAAPAEPQAALNGAPAERHTEPYGEQQFADPQQFAEQQQFADQQFAEQQFQPGYQQEQAAGFPAEQQLPPGQDPSGPHFEAVQHPRFDAQQYAAEAPGYQDAQPYPEQRYPDQHDQQQYQDPQYQQTQQYPAEPQPQAVEQQFADQQFADQQFADQPYPADDRQHPAEQQPYAQEQQYQPEAQYHEEQYPAAAAGHAVPAEQPAPSSDLPGNDAVDRLDETPAEPVEVVLALGANLGDPQATLRAAVLDLDRIAGLQITEVSPLARTAAVGGPEQPDYLNAVVVARTRLSPRGLLHACQAVEHAHGRTREEHWGPRTLDIDVITYGLLTAAADDLEVPHPRAHERAFVLEPWSQLKPEAVLPGLGGGPVAQLAATAADRGGIRWLALDWLTESNSGADPTGDVEPQPTASHRPYNPPAHPQPEPPVQQAPEQPMPGAPGQGHPQGHPGDQYPQQAPQQSAFQPPQDSFQPPQNGAPASVQGFGSGSTPYPQQGAVVPPPQEALVPAPPLPAAERHPAQPVAAPVVPAAVRETAHQEISAEPIPVEPPAPAKPVFAPVRPQPGDVPFAPVNHAEAAAQPAVTSDERPAWMPVLPDENGQRG